MQHNEDVLAVRRYLVNKIAALEEANHTLRQESILNNKMWSDFQRAKAVVKECRAVSQHVTEDAFITYKLSLYLCKRKGNAVAYNLVLYRCEWVEGPVAQERNGLSKYRKSRVRVANSKFVFDYNRTGNRLSDPVTQTLAHPRNGIFSDHQNGQTFERQRFFSLITHVQFLIAAKLRKSVEIVAATATTMGFLERYYSACKVDDPDIGPLPPRRSINTDGSPNPQRATGDYFVNQSCMNLLSKGEEENEELVTMCDRWAEYIQDEIKKNLTHVNPPGTTLRFGGKYVQ